MNTENNNEQCPNCGYCKHCGRGGYRYQWTIPYMPSYPYPYTTGPIWYYTPSTTVTAGQITGGTSYIVSN